MSEWHQPLIYFWLLSPSASQAQPTAPACRVSVCAQTQPSISAGKLNPACYHWRPKCRSWFECSFQLTSVPGQVTFLSVFLLWVSPLLAVWLANSCSAVGTCPSHHRRVALSCLALLSWGLINMHFGSSFPAPLGLRYASHKHFTATFSCSNAYSSDDKANVNAAFRHFLRCIVLHLCPKSVERGGKKT